MPNTLVEKIQHVAGDYLDTCVLENNEITIEVPSNKIKSLATLLRDEPDLKFTMLIDICGVDYATYGVSEWATSSVSATGFSRGVRRGKQVTHASVGDAPSPQSSVSSTVSETTSSADSSEKMPHRFAVVYHLLSIEHNHRLRVRCFLPGEPPMIDSVTKIWAAADWFEREAFDLMGILFNGHPDLRRILTDYGFIGHPFRKDFPLSGNVEVRYDATQGRVIYEPVDIEPRVLVPKVIRQEGKHAPQPTSEKS